MPRPPPPTFPRKILNPAISHDTAAVYQHPASQRFGRRTLTWHSPSRASLEANSFPAQIDRVRGSTHIGRDAQPFSVLVELQQSTAAVCSPANCLAVNIAPPTCCCCTCLEHFLQISVLEYHMKVFANNSSISSTISNNS